MRGSFLSAEEKLHPFLRNERIVEERSRDSLRERGTPLGSPVKVKNMSFSGRGTHLGCKRGNFKRCNREQKKEFFTT